MIDKYSNLEKLLPQLQPVLRESIQSEFLEIQKLDRTCMKFKSVVKKLPTLENAIYVIFSRFIRKNEHKYETFIFLDNKGNSIAHISGRELELYGVLEPCINLHVSEEYEAQKKEE